MLLKRAFLLLSLPFLSLGLLSCDSGGLGQIDDLESNSFKATVEGTSVEKHDFAGSLAVQGSDWNGAAFLFDFGDRWGDSDIDTTRVFFSLNLSPDTGIGLERREGINITYLGSDLAAGSYDIMAVDEEDPFGRGQFEEGVFHADYYKFDAPEDSSFFGGDIELYPAKIGTITLTEVTTETVQGSFTFEAEICRCFNFADLLQRLVDQFEDGRGDGGEWEDPFEDATIERDLSAEGSFNVDITDARDFDFEDRGDGGGVRINRTPGQGRGR